jgi:purine-nucleoside phosphorylase
MGADAVGMSTVPEVMAARQLKRRVLAIATISNRAAGLAGKPLSHEEVLTAGRAASRNLADLLDAILLQILQRRSLSADRRTEIAAQVEEE